MWVSLVLAKSALAASALSLRDDLVSNAVRDLLVVRWSDVRLSATLGEGAQRCDVSEHFGERHNRFDDGDSAWSWVHSFDTSSSTVDVANDVSNVGVWSGDLRTWYV